MPDLDDINPIPNAPADQRRAEDDAAGFVPLQERQPFDRVVPAFPWSAYRVLIGE